MQYFFKVLQTDFTIQYFQYRVGTLTSRTSRTGVDAYDLKLENNLKIKSVSTVLITPEWLKMNEKSICKQEC